MLKYIVREFWNSARLKVSEKEETRRILLEKVATLDSKIAHHLVRGENNR